MTISVTWAAFLVIVGVIGVAGYRMCSAADDIAEISGWSRAWIGLLLLSIATSLPELVTGVSAIAVFDAPNVAIGDALGSCVFNLVMLVVLELVGRGESLYTRAGTGHVVSAAFGVILTGFVAFSVLVSHELPGLRLGHVGLYSPLILGAYVAAMYTVFHYERRLLADTRRHEPLIPGVEGRSLRTAVRRYAISALFVAAAGGVLPRVATEIATHRVRRARDIRARSRRLDRCHDTRFGGLGRREPARQQSLRRRDRRYRRSRVRAGSSLSCRLSLARRHRNFGGNHERSGRCRLQLSATSSATQALELDRRDAAGHISVEWFRAVLSGRVIAT